MTPEDMIGILDQIRYKDWSFRLSDDGQYLQVAFIEECILTKQPSIQHGRKWIMSPHMTKSEVVCTAFKAVMTAEEHEIRERFRYKRRMIFGPHFDVDELAKIAGKIDVRENMEADHV